VENSEFVEKGTRELELRRMLDVIALAELSDSSC